MNDEEVNYMKPEYDFSRAERGKHFAKSDAVLHFPVYLDQDIQTFLMEKAAAKGVDLGRLVNDPIEAQHRDPPRRDIVRRGQPRTERLSRRQ